MRFLSLKIDKYHFFQWFCCFKFHFASRIEILFDFKIILHRKCSSKAARVNHNFHHRKMIFWSKHYSTYMLPSKIYFYFNGGYLLVWIWSILYQNSLKEFQFSNACLKYKKVEGVDMDPYNVLINIPKKTSIARAFTQNKNVPFFQVCIIILCQVWFLVWPLSNIDPP